MLKRLLGVLTALLALTVLVSCGDDDSKDEGSNDDKASGETSCDFPSDGQQPAREVNPPPAKPEVSGKIEKTIATNVGDLKITLDADAAPCTVQSFVSLADQGYFDDTVCHRLVPEGIFVLQCGDPAATGDSQTDGTGGPGYTIPDEVTGDEKYTAGTVAMGRLPNVENSGGSQFFIVYETNEGLTPEYTIFGQIDEAGVDVVRKVAEKGLAANGVAPKEKVTITSVK